MFNTLIDATVCFTVQTHGLKTGTVTFSDFNGQLTNDRGLVEDVQFVDDFGNNMAKRLQVLQEIKQIDIFHLEWVKVLEIRDIEFNDDLCGFVVTIQDGRTVQVQFELNQDKLNADYGTFTAVIDRENTYGLDLNTLETELFNDWLKCSDTILNHTDKLNIDHANN